MKTSISSRPRLNTKNEVNFFCRWQSIRRQFHFLCLDIHNTHVSWREFRYCTKERSILGREVLRVGIDVYSYRTGLHNLQWWISLPYSTLDGQTAMDLLASSHYQLEDLWRRNLNLDTWCPPFRHHSMVPGRDSRGGSEPPSEWCFASCFGRTLEAPAEEGAQKIYIYDVSVSIYIYIMHREGHGRKKKRRKPTKSSPAAPILTSWSIWFCDRRPKGEPSSLTCGKEPLGLVEVESLPIHEGWTPLSSFPSLYYYSTFNQSKI